MKNLFADVPSKSIISWQHIFAIGKKLIKRVASLANDSADILDLSEEEIKSAIMEVDDVAATYDCVECKLLNVQPVA